jgi:hypothetical protein
MFEMPYFLREVCSHLSCIEELPKDMRHKLEQMSTAMASAVKMLESNGEAEKEEAPSRRSLFSIAR